MAGVPDITLTDDPARPGGCRLDLAGRVTAADAARLHAAARAAAARGGDVRVGFARAEHVDASAVQIVLALGRDLAGRGKRCDVADVPAAVGEVFRLAGLGG